jgi:diguanylate cyclase (GGDEF)-like protein
VLELADRERSLAALSQLALRAPVTIVREAGARVTRRHTTQPCDEQDQQFLNAVTGVLTAAAERDRATKELLHRATHDDLTGLPNRSAVQSQVARALIGEAVATPVSVALCDLDRFKAVNDVHGHQAGDDVLTVVAKRLAGILLPCDQLGRFGGDEFAVVCTDSGGKDTMANLAARIQGAFVQPVRTRHVQARITASVGVATTDCTKVTLEADSLLRDAGTALHDAKGRGSGTVGVFSETMRSALVHRADIERRMTVAVRRQEILVHYQPVLDISSRKIVGFEALARWQQGLVLVAPAEWIPVVETTDLIHAVGEQVLTQASAQLHRWWTAGWRPQLSVNVSARQLASPQFMDTVRRSLPTGLPPSAITLEVTESTAVDDQAIALLTTLRDAGSRIALDDFGTGYSALSAVARLPIDVIKIDQSITRRVAHPDGQALVSATLAIAAALGLDVVAEGVETEDQHLRLLELGCPRGQGYLYSRPVDAAAATRMLEAGLPVTGQAVAGHS